MHPKVTRRRGLTLLAVTATVGMWAGVVAPPASAATTWTQQAELVASDGAAYQFYGHSVAYDGTTAIVGSDFNDAPASAWVYTGSGSSWTKDATLTVADTSACFGNAVAVSGATALVSDPCGNGAVYVFTLSGGEWSNTATLTVSDAQYFGTAIALDGSTALISNPGASTPEAYIFTKSRKGVWSQSAKLTPSASSGVDLNTALGGYQGTVALSGQTAVIGAADAANGTEYNSGAAYVFQAKGKRWAQAAELLGSNAYDGFGSSVATDGASVVIGASNASKAYVYSLGRRNSVSLATTLTGQSGETFGFSVGVSGPNVIVGARDGNTAYAYTSADSWANVQTLTPDTSTSTTTPYQYGCTVAIHGATAFVGADDSYATYDAQGAAYVFTLA